MSSNPRVFFPHSSPSGRVKHLFLASAERPGQRYAPKLYFEARIDLSDIRSGYRDAASVNLALDLHSLDGGGDTVWTRDMARAVDPSKLVSSPPEGAVLDELPSFVDPAYVSRMETLFLSFVMRYHAVSVFRNFELQIYSEPGEALGDFHTRCLYLLGEAFRLELDSLHETFIRRLEQIRERSKPGGAGFEAEKLESILGSRMHEVSERIADLFLKTELTADGPLPGRPAQPLGGFELDARLTDVCNEARCAIGALLARHQDKLRMIDEYSLHPSFKDIHLARSAILWVPDGQP